MEWGVARESIYLKGNSENIGWWNGSNKKKLVELFFSFPCESDWMDDVHVIQKAHTHFFNVYVYICFYANREWERIFFRALALWHLLQEDDEDEDRTEKGTRLFLFIKKRVNKISLHHQYNGWPCTSEIYHNSQ